MMIEDGDPCPDAMRVARVAFMAKEEGIDLDLYHTECCCCCPCCCLLYIGCLRRRGSSSCSLILGNGRPQQCLSGRGTRSSRYIMRNCNMYEVVQVAKEKLAEVGLQMYQNVSTTIERQHVYKLIDSAGMLGGIRKAFDTFQESLMVHNAIAGGVGEAYGKPTSIPQGDPFSVAIASLLMRAWVIQMRKLVAQPSVRADDVQILCTGPNRLMLFGNVLPRRSVLVRRWS